MPPGRAHEYEVLAYAPRRTPPREREADPSAPTSTSTSSTPPSTSESTDPPGPPPPVGPAAPAHTHATGSVAAAQHVQHAMAAQIAQLGLPPTSLGAALADKLASVPVVGGPGDWGCILALLAGGHATLLLPRVDWPSADEVTPATALDHLLLNPAQRHAGAPLVTASGLRAVYDAAGCALVFSAFVPDPHFTVHAEPSSLIQIARSLVPLAPAIALDDSNPRVVLVGTDPSFTIAPAIVRRATVRPADRRPRPSSTFERLFAGSRPPRASVGPGLREHVNRPAPDEANVSFEQVVGRQAVTVPVWTIDSIVTRPVMLRSISLAAQSRISRRLGAANVPSDVVDVVNSFAAAFYPPTPSQAAKTTSPTSMDKRGSGASFGSSHSGSNQVPFVPASRSDSDAGITLPYQGSVEEVTDTLQSLYASVAPQLSLTSREREPLSASVRSQLQAIEDAVTQELYDRLFAPPQFKDRELDGNLASRIAALNLLGLDLPHLGLVLPTTKSEAGVKLREGLDNLIAQCGACIANVDAVDRQTPQSKLAALVEAHHLLAEGVSQLPPIELRDEPVVDAADAASPHAGLDGGHTKPVDIPSAKPTQGAPSADLILPLLIFSVVKSNPRDLVSQLLFTERFRAQALQEGEESYALVNLQASVAFVENVSPSALGFEDADAVLPPPTIPKREAPPARPRGDDSFSALDRVRTRLASDFGELAGASNKVVSGVLGSSITAFGRILGTPPGGGGTDAVPPSLTQEVEQQHPAPHSPPAVRRGTPAPPLLSTAASEPERSTRERKVSSSVPLEDRDDSTEVPRASLSERLAALPVLGRLGAGAGAGTRPPSWGSGPAPRPEVPSSLLSPYPALSRPPSGKRPLHVVLACSGSVASLKVPHIVSGLLAHRNVRVQVVATPASLHFFDRQQIEAIAWHASGRPMKNVLDLGIELGENPAEAKAPEPPTPTPAMQALAATELHDDYTVLDLALENLAASRRDARLASKRPRLHLWTDQDEWGQWKRVRDPILHIELRRWADVVIIAPCSADLLAKLNAGLCDTLVVRPRLVLSRRVAVPTVLTNSPTDKLPARAITQHPYLPVPCDEHAHVDASAYCPARALRLVRPRIRCRWAH